jgi:hypothetical protein
MPTFDDLAFHPDFEAHQSAAGRRLVTVVVLGTAVPGTWVAYTAWDTKP